MDAFAERQYKSQHDRYVAAARVALESLQKNIGYALAELERGQIPSASLTEKVTNYDRALQALTAIEELREVYQTVYG